uniref:Putative LOC100902024 [Metaseiulus occidentalis] n=1 Tax=Lepeophtheirus salmonis TaxID=72036 RepID=A0A0K2UDH8_LEPSM
MQQCINSSLFEFHGNYLHYNKVLLFLTDGVSYYFKADKGLKMMYPNLMHCLIHGLNRAVDLARYSFPNLYKFIAEVKKIFINCTHCKLEFAAFCNVSHPPDPVVTR